MQYSTRPCSRQHVLTNIRENLRNLADQVPDRWKHSSMNLDNH